MANAKQLLMALKFLGGTERNLMDTLSRPTVEKFYLRSKAEPAEVINARRQANTARTFVSDPNKLVETYGNPSFSNPQGTIGGRYSVIPKPYTTADEMARQLLYDTEFENNVRRGLGVFRPIARTGIVASPFAGYGLGTSLYDILNSLGSNNQ